MGQHHSVSHTAAVWYLLLYMKINFLKFLIFIFIFEVNIKYKILGFIWEILFLSFLPFRLCDSGTLTDILATHTEWNAARSRAADCTPWIPASSHISSHS